MQTTSISGEQVVEVAESVFSTMLSLSTQPGPSPSVARGSYEVAGVIHITGTWNGTVLLLCSEPFGRRAASIMLDSPLEQVTLADVHDVVAELTNIIGGGIKSVLPSPSALSLPTVVQGSDFHMHVHWTQEVAHGELTCDGESLQVRVLESSCELKPVEIRRSGSA
jgi:chemotaxis protein CheX